MSDWVGFTDEDLHRLQNGDGVVKERPKIVKPIAKRTMQGNNNKAKQRPNNLEKSAVRKSTPNKNKQQQVSSAALLSKPTAAKTEKKPEPKPEETIPDIKEMEQNMEKPTQKDNGIVLDDEIGKKKEKLKLEDAQQRQKQMEEMNRRKKAMLTKEIAERKKRAIAESSKLVKIQTELTKLDQLLNVDVSILRDQIDEACWEFSQAQRRFQQAEKEYIASKMDLHEKTTRKEDLTEHLFNIIQANEERKAKKLEELMLKLNLEEEELELREQERREKEEKKEKEERERKEKEEREKIKKEQREKIEKEGKEKMEMEEKAKIAEIKEENTSVTNESVENEISNETLHGANTTPVVVPENN